MSPRAIDMDWEPPRGESFWRRFIRAIFALFRRNP